MRDALRSSFEVLCIAVRIASSNFSRTAVTAVSDTGAGTNAGASQPTLRRSSSIASQIWRMISWPNSMAPRTTSSGSSFAPPSTIVTASRVPATTRSRGELCSTCASGNAT